ncbi:MAG: polysaccharide deacetylase family protein, partial [Acidobacteriota bacterium]
PIVLPILGDSDQLTTQQKKSMADWRQEVRDFTRVNQGKIFINGPQTDKMVCLTFDDGPDDIVTPQIIAILNYYQVKGNFFFKGNQVRKYQEVVKQAYEDGHLVLSHAYSHQELNKMNGHDIDKEIWATDKVFDEVLGIKPALMRPPFGAVNQDVLNEADHNGDKLILWSIDTLDWSQKDKENIAQNVLRNVRPGEIILMHCNQDKQATADALPLIIEGLSERGYQIVSLSEMLQVPAYKE